MSDFSPDVFKALGNIDNSMAQGTELHRSMRLDRELLREPVVLDTETETVSDACTVVVDQEPEPPPPPEQVVARAAVEAGRNVFRDDQLVVCPCGVVLPASKKHLEVARLFPWYRVCKPFNRVFYRLLDAKGVDGPTAQAAIHILREHRTKGHLDITDAQVRGLYGLGVGVCGFDGKLVSAAKHGALTQDGEDDSPPKFSSGFTDAEWPLVQEEALEACKNKPETVDFQTEMRWVMCRAKEWPDFSTGPSVLAIKTWLIINDPDGVESLTKDLLKMTWAKRMAPGDNGRKTGVFEEDEEPKQESGATRHDEELERRLFGGNG